MSLFARYEKAVEEEKTARDLAFVPFPVPLCGIRVRQLCPLHVLLLEHCGNRFVIGGIPQVEDIAGFLWFVSEDYCLDLKKRDAFVRRKVGNLPYLKSVREIADFLKSAYSDAPSGYGIVQKQYTSWLAGLIDRLASEYGWDDEAIMRKPIARLCQYVRCIEKRHAPRAIQFNRSDVVLGEIMAERNAQAQGRN